MGLLDLCHVCPLLDTHFYFLHLIGEKHSYSDDELNQMPDEDADETLMKAKIPWVSRKALPRQAMSIPWTD